MADNYRPRTIIYSHVPVQKTFQIKPNHLYPRLANFPSLNHHLCNHSLHTHTRTRTHTHTHTLAHLIIIFILHLSAEFWNFIKYILVGVEQ